MDDTALGTSRLGSDDHDEKNATGQVKVSEERRAEPLVEMLASGIWRVNEVEPE